MGMFVSVHVDWRWSTKVSTHSASGQVHKCVVCVGLKQRQPCRPVEIRNTQQRTECVFVRWCGRQDGAMPFHGWIWKYPSTWTAGVRVVLSIVKMTIFICMLSIKQTIFNSICVCPEVTFALLNVIHIQLISLFFNLSINMGWALLLSSVSE